MYVFILQRIYAESQKRFLKYKEDLEIYEENKTPEQIREEVTKRKEKETKKLKKV